MDYTLTIRPANDNEWRAVIDILGAMQVTNVIIDEQGNTILISEHPVTLARIISVIAGTLYTEE